MVSLVLVYTAYVAEVYRAGIESVHESQTAAARSLGLSRWESLRFVILPQAIRRVIPPLLNDFIGLQKDTALVASIGVVEAFRQAQIESSNTFNYTPFLAAAMLFVLVTIPLARFTDWLIARRPAGVGRPGASTVSEALRLEGVHKSFGKLDVLRGIDLAVAEHEVICLIGASGSGKSTMLRCVNLLEPIDAGRIMVEGVEITAAGVDLELRPQTDRHRLPVVQPVPAHDRDAERDARADRRCSTSRRRMRWIGLDSCSTGSGWRTRRTSTPIACRAGSNSVSRSFARWRCSPRSCCWTRSRARSTPSSSPRCST